MGRTKLGQLLDYFENTPGTASIADIASDLEITVSQAENMLAFWVRKGKIRISTSLTDCSSCGVNGECPLAFDLPRVYELVRPDGAGGDTGIIHCSS